MNVKELWMYRKKLSCSHNLIHCITNPIAMNDCANAILALGANPIMAQHPAEVEQITASSKALAVNLGNFEDIRAQAMQVSAACANHKQIPIIIDLVGVGCSDLRKQFANKFINTYHPNIVKGNVSEIKAMSDLPSHAQGIDAGEMDKDDAYINSQWIQKLAQKWNCVVLCTGEIDIVADPNRIMYIYNGCEMLTKRTATGCMLHAICASFMSCMPAFDSAVMASAFFGIASEKASEESLFPGKFHVALFDWLYRLEENDFIMYRKVNSHGGAK